MTRRLLVSHRAEADLVAIWRWTRETFGESQADGYLDELEAGMKECARRPKHGKDRSNLRAGYRSRLVGSHIVFYTFTADEVLIQRVLHGGMDFDSRLPS